MNTVELLKGRYSIRKYNKEKITDEQLNEILECAMRAPTAGAMMLYSIIVIRDKLTLSKLAKSCDNQPFIADSDIALIFVADYTKWLKYFKLSDVKSINNGNEVEGTIADFMLGINDALISAQSAVVAAESMNIGTCYIGDIMENYEYHKELLNLPKGTFPAAMITLGNHDIIDAKLKHRFKKEFIVFEEVYKELSDSEVIEMFESTEEKFRPENFKDVKNFAQMFFKRKQGAEFFEEMNRSIWKYIEEWK